MSEDKPEGKKHKFEKLTPRLDVELGIYEDALDFVFDNNDTTLKWTEC